MSMLVKKRQLVMATLVVALGAAVFVNWYYTRSTDSPEKDGNKTEYIQNLGEAKYVSANVQTEPVAEDVFAEIKLNREKSRDEALDNLKTTLNGLPVDSEAAQSVAKSVDEYGRAVKEESDIESLISAKLSISSVAVINKDKAQIIVEKGKLNEESVLVITDIVTSNSSVKAENVKITEAK